MRWKDIINETSSCGATSSGNIATISSPLGGIHSRSGESFFGGASPFDPEGQGIYNTKSKKDKKKKIKG